MTERLHLHHPWFVAAWPGMGNVALNAGIYLLAKLGMNLVAEFEAGELFDVDQVDVKDGLIQPARKPRSRFFVWVDPKHKHDLIVFLGEAQPPIGKFPFCKQLISYARQLGVERVFTFAAMATEMHPEKRSGVFGATTDPQGLEELKQLELSILEGGQIGGLNGILLAAASEAHLRGTCLLGEMPHLFAKLPFPKASQAILEVFATITGVELDFTELAEQARIMEHQLAEFLTQVEQTYGLACAGEEEEGAEQFGGAQAAVETDDDSLSARRIEWLFEEAARNRAKAFELKQELDRQGVFKEYENRFLDLFKKRDR